MFLGSQCPVTPSLLSELDNNVVVVRIYRNERQGLHHTMGDDDDDE